MRSLFIIIITLMTICNAQQLKQGISKDSKFLDSKIKNPEFQIEIDNLKKDYENELAELKSKFKSEKKSLRKRYKEKFKIMKKEFKNSKNQRIDFKKN